MRKRNCNGVTIVEILALIVITGILLTMIAVFIKKVDDMDDANMVCVEWEDAQVTDCWGYGIGTTCEHRTEKRCVRYEYNDGGTKTE